MKRNPYDRVADGAIALFLMLISLLVFAAGGMK
jgi:hypothetical protein